MTPIQLWTKHRPLARKIAGAYFLPGAERQDVEQEAMIGLWEAALSYRDDMGCSFRTFADTVVVRRLNDAVKAANRKKQQPLNLSTRDHLAVRNLPHLHQVSDRCEEREDIRRLLVAIGRLSEWERQCVVGVASGLSYAEIGNPSKVDNTLVRARQKLREVTC